MKVFIEPNYNRPDAADGGIRRVVEAQKKYLPEFGWDVVDRLEGADLVALHAGIWRKEVSRRTPIVSHSHGLYWDGYEWEKWHHELNDDVIYSIMHADAVTAPSEWVANALRRNFALRPIVLYHGIDANDWNAESTVRKGYVLWNKARTDAICDSKPVTELAKRAIGTQFITTFAETPPPNVLVTGPVPYEQAKSYIENASVYLATTRETFGVGTLEAMACGVPILGWNFAGQKEIVEHKVTGWLAPLNDYDSLAEGLAWCLANRAEIGGRARTEIETKWTWREAIQRYAALYTKTYEAKQQENVAPRTSIIVTNYNLGKYLPACVDSILAQTDGDFEVILIDDASNDGTSRDVAIAQAARGDFKTHLILHEKNVYLAESLNDGVRAANGRYILPLDADNQIAPNTLEVLGDRLDQDRDVDIAYGRVQFLRESDGSEIETTWPPTKFSLTEQLNHRNQIPSTSLYRRRIWERVGGYRARCYTAEDADFWCRATSFGARPARATDAVTLIYLNREDSMSHVQKDWAWEAWYPWGLDDYQYLTPPAALTGAHRRVIAAEKPIISVVIPVGPKHTRIVFDALDSVRAQTFEAWEVILVNDSGAPLQEIPSWVNVICRDGNLSTFGPSGSRNEGMLYAKGRYFIFLDADDYLEPTALEKMFRMAGVLEPDQFVYSDWIIEEEKRAVKAKEYDCGTLLVQLEYPVTALYPMSAWAASGGFDSDYTIAWEDWDFALRIARGGYCGVRLPEPLLHYRMSKGTRREEGFAQREELKKLIYAKWQPYIEGKEKLMACSSCGGRRVPSPASYSSASSLASVSPPSDATLVEYTGTSQTPLIFRGKVTQKNYRFGLDPEYRTRYVNNADVNGFLAMADFQLATSGEPALV